MAYRPNLYRPTRREALRDVALAGGLAAAGGLALPGVLSLPAAAASGDQLIVAVSATPVSLDPEFGASLESWELPVFIYEYLLCYHFKKDAEGRRDRRSSSRHTSRASQSEWSFRTDGKNADFSPAQGRQERIRKRVYRRRT